jgi:hypothetical protein
MQPYLQTGLSNAAPMGVHAGLTQALATCGYVGVAEQPTFILSSPTTVQCVAINNIAIYMGPDTAKDENWSC